MTYQVLARKWRPQDFSSLVGQEPIVTALQNALTEDRIAQAYVFSGIRGVGKTTAARILSKALNCERGIGSEERSGGDPCNDCPSCREITEGSDVINVREIDAATYSKVEQVRELTESLRLGATRSDRYKVVIMDEVHRLSRQAFDALLKIVEEPPPQLVFIFATTELDAVPATVLSRCQEFQFRRVPSPILAQHLRVIADAETIEVSDAALRMIARAGEGSVRDSVALLDQLATFGSGKISDQDANQLLGGLDADIFRRLLTGILTCKHGTITSIIHEIEENGWDPHHVYSQFLGYVRDALHLALGSRPESIDLPLEEAKTLGEVVGGSSYESLLQLAQLLLSGEQTVKRSEFSLLALEITWLRAAELPKITRLEDLLSGRADVKVPDAVAANVASAAPPAPRNVTASAASPPSRPPVTTSSKKASGSIAHFRTLLKARLPLSARFNDDVHLAFEDGMLLIHCPNDADDLKKALERQSNAEFFTNILKETWPEGTGYEIRTSANEPAFETETPPAPPPQALPTPQRPTKRALAKQEVVSQDHQLGKEERTKIEQHPAVKAVLDVFPGKIRSIDPRRLSQET